MGAKLNFDLLAKRYFYWDKPVDYNIDTNTSIKIYPIQLVDSEIFLASVDILKFDKNSIPDPDIIRMTYLEFMVKYLLPDEDNRNASKLLNICHYCLKWDSPQIVIDDKGKYYLANSDGSIKISSKRFNDIRRIILYQNIVDYDDSYINPELRKAMERTDALRSYGMAPITIERKMAIITAHNGMSKDAQTSMTLRAHTMLFREVCGEADFAVTWPIALYAGKTDKMDHWIHKKSKSKFDGYVVERSAIVSKLGGKDDAIQSTESGDNSLDDMYNNFRK